jgi:tetratricopeptide (TPR) repeat protein
MTSFLEAGRQFQLLESTDGDGAAMLGIAQTLIGQEQWVEAIEHCEGALTRFNQSGDLVGQADTILALGLAHRGKGDLEEAASQFEQAVTMYQQQRQPLGESDARYERAGTLLAREQLDLARNDLTRAIELVERVMHTLRLPEQWSTFLHQYAELYAQAAIAAVRRNRDAEALAILSSFARIAGEDAIVQHIKDYENSVPTSGDELTEDEVAANKDLVRRLRELRKRL